MSSAPQLYPTHKGTWDTPWKSTHGLTPLLGLEFPQGWDPVTV